MIRAFIVAVIVSLFGALAPAHADAPTIRPTHVEAAARMLRATYLDTGILPEMASEAARLAGPQVVEAMRTTPFFRSLTEDNQQAIADYYINDYGTVAREEAIRGGSELIERFAPRFAALFSEAELGDLTALAQSQHGPAALRVMIFSGLRGEQPEFTPEQIATLESFVNTPGGRVFTTRRTEFQQLGREFGEAIGGAPTTSGRIQRDMCALIGSQCPAEWRN